MGHRYGFNGILNTKNKLPRAIFLLSACNAYLYINQSLLITISVLIGFELAADKRLATLPIAFQFLTVMVTTITVSLFMGRFGRTTGFLLGCLIGIVGAAIALWSLFNQSFYGYCFATICFGAFAATSHYYRFTAAEIVPPDMKSRAISMVMAGGVIAAFLGPNLANWSSGMFDSNSYAGPFVVLIANYLVCMLTVVLAKLPPAVKKAVTSAGEVRRVVDIISQPVFIIAASCQMFGYGTMNLIMTSTPLAMNSHTMTLGAVALVIQWHVVSMFAPSFVTGKLIERFGFVCILTCGVALSILCIVINFLGETVLHFMLALIFLGVSWNFLFVGGTTLLTETYNEAEKSKTQAANDFLVFSTVAITALSAGTLHHLFGWRIVNLVSLPLLLLIVVAIIWLHQLNKTRVA